MDNDNDTLHCTHDDEATLQRKTTRKTTTTIGPKYFILVAIQGDNMIGVIPHNCCVVVDCDYSTCKQVRSGVPQGRVLSPLMFLLFINDIGDHLNNATILLFACDCLLSKTISNQDNADRLQDNLKKTRME